MGLLSAAAKTGLAYAVLQRVVAMTGSGSPKAAFFATLCVVSFIELVSAFLRSGSVYITAAKIVLVSLVAWYLAGRAGILAAASEQEEATEDAVPTAGMFGAYSPTLARYAPLVVYFAVELLL